MSLKGQRSPLRRACCTTDFLLLAGLGICALLTPTTSGGLARPGTEDPGPDSSERAALPAGQGSTLAEGIAATSPAALAPRASGRTLSAPPESAFVQRVDPASIPPEVRERLWVRRTEREKEIQERRGSRPEDLLPPVDPDAHPPGIARPMGPDRIIRGAEPEVVPVEAEKRLRSRFEERDRGKT